MLMNQFLLKLIVKNKHLNSQGLGINYEKQNTRDR